jgi:hypothetical protein
MSEETKVELPKHTDEIKGTSKEQLAAKVAIIRDHGYDAWAAIVAASARSTKR